MTPLEFAVSHQNEMGRLLRQIHANAGCIRQLLVGRTVRRRSDRAEFTVTEARLGLSNSITLHGRAPGKRRGTMIGTMRDIEIVEPKP